MTQATMASHFLELLQVISHPLFNDGAVERRQGLSRLFLAMVGF